ncbi:hypothetical protein SARC_14433 [Sphaeroforma arctica JP610]|uniref:Uncharacterized protein n=1 Tax=Sphaeroforma arctica JP610 TaxID=667725 RepID=A0A0L0F8F5_9EUKA|nr:hypothetical protein SARC_14433 [Sphaeroforma arctica JP610]KNC73004.1 hypothetical protein SARC_14433 [Sphaeroforma arctica JP610]|eukprot:XP_014146906.1 hypothetical protein SARC_14433 [Sphaeroforma arctica JP610]
MEEHTDDGDDIADAERQVHAVNTHPVDNDGTEHMDLRDSEAPTTGIDPEGENSLADGVPVISFADILIPTSSSMREGRHRNIASDNGATRTASDASAFSPSTTDANTGAANAPVIIVQPADSRESTAPQIPVVPGVIIEDASLTPHSPTPSQADFTLPQALIDQVLASENSRDSSDGTSGVDNGSYIDRVAALYPHMTACVGAGATVSTILSNLRSIATDLEKENDRWLVESEAAEDGMVVGDYVFIETLCGSVR